VTFHRGRRLAFDAVIEAGAVYPSGSSPEP
jgi:hypothetical protein